MSCDGFELGGSVSDMILSCGGSGSELGGSVLILVLSWVVLC